MVTKIDFLKFNIVIKITTKEKPTIISPTLKPKILIPEKGLPKSINSKIITKNDVLKIVDIENFSLNGLFFKYCMSNNTFYSIR